MFICKKKYNALGFTNNLFSLCKFILLWLLFSIRKTIFVFIIFHQNILGNTWRTHLCINWHYEKCSGNVFGWFNENRSGKRCHSHAYLTIIVAFNKKNKCLFLKAFIKPFGEHWEPISSLIGIMKNVGKTKCGFANNLNGHVFGWFNECNSLHTN